MYPRKKLKKPWRVNRLTNKVNSDRVGVSLYLTSMPETDTNNTTSTSSADDDTDYTAPGYNPADDDDSALNQGISDH